MKFRITINATKILAFLITLLSFILSYKTGDNSYWTMGVPMAISIALGRDLATNFGKNVKEC